MKKYIDIINLFFQKNKSITKYSIKISSKEKVNLLEQLSNLLNSGIPLINSFKIIMYQTKSKKIKLLLKEFIEMLNK
jgi:type II secretory pathway component PulF